jgi:hypothetical protein
MKMQVVQKPLPPQEGTFDLIFSPLGLPQWFNGFCTTLWFCVNLSLSWDRTLAPGG